MKSILEDIYYVNICPAEFFQVNLKEYEAIQNEHLKTYDSFLQSLEGFFWKNIVVITSIYRRLPPNAIQCEAPFGRGWVRLLPTLWNPKGSPSSDPASPAHLPPRGRRWQALYSLCRKIP